MSKAYKIFKKIYISWLNVHNLSTHSRPLLVIHGCDVVINLGGTSSLSLLGVLMFVENEVCGVTAEIFSFCAVRVVCVWSCVCAEVCSSLSEMSSILSKGVVIL